VLPGVLTAMGLLQLAGAVSVGMRPQDLGLLAVGLAAAAGLGRARGATVAVSVRDGRPWLRYRAVTLALWAATVAGSGSALLLLAGATLLAEGVIVAHRAATSGGQQWQARVCGQKVANGTDPSRGLRHYLRAARKGTVGRRSRHNHRMRVTRNGRRS